MAGKHPHGKNSPQAKRLRTIRGLMGYEVAAEFAEKFLKIGASRWNNFEVGHPLSREVASLLCLKIPGLTLDWLENGETRGLSVDLAKRIGELPELPAAAKKAAGSRRERVVHKNRQGAGQ